MASLRSDVIGSLPGLLDGFLASHFTSAAASVTIKWIFNVANGDLARQEANIEDLINKGVDIVMARRGIAAISASIKAAKAANIPFISFDRASTGAKPTAHVGETAMTMPLWLGRLLPNA